MSWIQGECSHEGGAPLYGGRLLRCAVCGMVRTAARQSFEYNDRYFTATDQGGYDFDSPFAKASDKARFFAELHRLERRGLRGRLLDIGCATGAFLEMARKRGWDVTGVECSAFARDLTSNRLGIPCVESLEQIPNGNAYDVVTLHHVLEHIPDPLPFLRDEVAPRVGRLLLIEVPNFSSLASRAEGLFWRDLRLEQHISHFEPATLSQLMSSAGFRVTRIYTMCDALWSIRASLETLRHLARTALLTRPTCEAGPVKPLTSSPRVPSGFRALAGQASFIAMRPLTRWMEVARLAPRLIVEAEPGSAVSNSRSRNHAVGGGAA